VTHDLAKKRHRYACHASRGACLQSCAILERMPLLCPPWSWWLITTGRIALPMTVRTTRGRRANQNVIQKATILTVNNPVRFRKSHEHLASFRSARRIP